MNGFFVACLERQVPTTELAAKLKRKAEDDDENDLDSLLTHDTSPNTFKRKKDKKTRKKRKTLA